MILLQLPFLTFLCYNLPCPCLFLLFINTFILITIFFKRYYKTHIVINLHTLLETDHRQQWGSLLHSLLVLWFKVPDGRMLPSGNLLLFTLRNNFLHLDFSFFSEYLFRDGTWILKSRG